MKTKIKLQTMVGINVGYRFYSMNTNFNYQNKVTLTHLKIFAEVNGKRQSFSR